MGNKYHKSIYLVEGKLNDIHVYNVHDMAHISSRTKAIIDESLALLLWDTQRKYAQQQEERAWRVGFAEREFEAAVAELFIERTYTVAKYQDLLAKYAAGAFDPVDGSIGVHLL